MFAGPNGSGKSTLKSVIQAHLLGVYINPDEIEKEIKQLGKLDFSPYQIETTEHEISHFLNQSTLLQNENLLEKARRLSLADNQLSFSGVSVNAYFASVCADFIRGKLIEQKISFTFETVMSAPDKLTLLKEAKKRGYRIYLYYIATNDPKINISRIQHRVKTGGHDVPENKVQSRYKRSLGHLSDVIRISDRAYLFDNSGDTAVWVCEITSGTSIEYKQDTIPKWLHQHVIKTSPQLQAVKR